MPAIVAVPDSFRVKWANTHLRREYQGQSWCQGSDSKSGNLPRPCPFGSCPVANSLLNYPRT